MSIDGNQMSYAVNVKVPEGKTNKVAKKSDRLISIDFLKVNDQQHSVVIDKNKKPTKSKIFKN